VGTVRELTEGVVSRVVNGKIDLKGLQKSMGIKTNSAVLIVGTRSTFLRVILLPAAEVAHISVSLSLVGFKDTAREMLNGIKQRNLQIVHSTGFCPLQDVCIWEGYFVVDDRKVVEELSTWIGQLKKIKGVQLSYLTA
jgi:hypothetical protein